ncbi:ATP-dependent DNA helicase PcrA [Candidatus Poribacteria bacterium]|nr:ATP-dependent DNA helicase PcrA [Candidatus Poribacteria bacterium]
MDILANLNEPQREAVLHTEGPLLLLAGAGSGKTRVLTHRIAYLIHEKGVPPTRILAVTFTNKAAGELKHRLETLVGPQSRSIWARTFHSTCVQILRRDIARLDGYTPTFTIFDDVDQVALMKHVLRSHQVDENRFRPRDVLGTISRAKNQMLGPQEVANSANYFEQRCAEFYETYQKQLRVTNALDFDDLILLAIRLFQEHPGVLSEYQHRFLYIHVDEYQDTNHSQYLLTRMLAEQHENICVVGDDDQSIYSWRGADIQNILDFERDYRKTTVISLGQNYRSTGNILSAAQNVVRFNRRRRGKELYTQNPEGALLRYFDAEDERQEAEYVCRTLRAMKSDGKPYGDCAIFYRINAMSRNFEDALRRENIPYQIVGGVKFYERMEVKDIISYLRVLVNPRDNISLQRIINTPTRGIGKTTLDRVQEFAEANDLTLMEAVERAEEIETLNAGARRSLAGFLTVLRSIQLDGSVPQIIESAIDVSGYLKSLQEQNTIEAEGRIENLSEFVSAAADYAEHEENPSLEGFLETITLATDVDGMEEAPDRVTLMTLHGAKGLEFPCVFLSGLEEGLFPHQRAMNSEAELEEERRLCYVGMTRAMQELHLSRARVRRVQGFQQETLRSRFLDEVPADLLEEVEPWTPTGFAPRGFGRRPSPEEARRLLSAAMTGTPAPKAPPAPTKSVSRFDPEPQTASSQYDFLRKHRRVAHAKFGSGKVLRVEGQGADLRVEVEFDDGTVKSLLAEFAKLRPL